MSPGAGGTGVEEAKAILAPVDLHERLYSAVDAPLVSFRNTAIRIHEQCAVGAEVLVAELQRNVVNAISAGQPERLWICIILVSAVLAVEQEIHAGKAFIGIRRRG